jgi:hypothetical protein
MAAWGCAAWAGSTDQALWLKVFRNRNYELVLCRGRQHGNRLCQAASLLEFERAIMSLSEIASVATAVSGLVVTVSLIYVAIQTRQETGEPFHIQQAAQIRAFHAACKEAAHGFRNGTRR